MSFSAIIGLVGSALKAVPIIAQELNGIRVSLDLAKNARAEQERQQILDRLNTLSSRLRTTEDENEMASIIRDLNRLV